MGDTLPSIATTISMTDRNFYLWDKGQLIVIISRTRLAIDTIFVGDKGSTLNALVAILKCRTQWTDHMENILKVVKINIDDDNVEIAIKRFETYEKSTEPVLEYYKKMNLIKDINGEIDIKGIFNEINDYLSVIEG